MRVLPACRWPLVVVVPVLLLACGDDADSRAYDSGSAVAAQDMPAIYLDQRIETRSRGENPQLAGYRHALEACESAGAATTPLSAQDEARVGTGRVQVWVEAGQAAYRVETWHFDATGDGPSGLECHFVLASRGAHALHDTRSTQVMDLSTNELREDAAQPHLLDRTPSGQPPVSEGRRTVAGHPCEELPVAGFEETTVCVWGGGHPWGFGHGAPAEPIPLDQPQRLLRYVVLSQEPGADDGYHVTTESLRIGSGSAGPDMAPAPATGIPSQRVRS